MVEQENCNHRGVQARIRKRIPTVQYVHYKAHVLALVIVHSSSDVSGRTMMDNVQEITFAFNYSSKKLINLSKNYVGTMP
jgi:hypothetical protein